MIKINDVFLLFLSLQSILDKYFVVSNIVSDTREISLLLIESVGKSFMVLQFLRLEIKAPCSQKMSFLISCSNCKGLENFTVIFVRFCQMQPAIFLSYIAIIRKFDATVSLLGIRMIKSQAISLGFFVFNNIIEQLILDVLVS